jgi:uncharacterized protein (TIGR02001 family)
MKIRILTHCGAAALLALVAAGAHAQATTAPGPDAGSQPFPPVATGLPITGNIALTSNYISRGFTQTWSKPALQGGFDYVNPNGIFLGTWLSSLSGTEFRGGTTEWDLYGGYSSTIGPLGYTAGLYYYAYPGSSSPFINGRKYNYGELKLGLNYKVASLTYYRVVTKDWFGTFNDGRGTGYVDLSVNPDLGNGYTLLLHAGIGKVANHSEADWKDYKVGVSKLFAGTWTLTGALTKATDKNEYWTGSNYSVDASGNTFDKRLGKTAFAVTLGKTF